MGGHAGHTRRNDLWPGVRNIGCRAKVFLGATRAVEAFRLSRATHSLFCCWRRGCGRAGQHGAASGLVGGRGFLWSVDPLRFDRLRFFPLLSLLGVLGAWAAAELAKRKARSGVLPLMLFGVASASLFQRALSSALLLRTKGTHPASGAWPCSRMEPGRRCGSEACRCLRKGHRSPFCLLLFDRSGAALVQTPCSTCRCRCFSANTARAFAHLIGLRADGGKQLQMMFYAELRHVSLWPGCNGRAREPWTGRLPRVDLQLCSAFTCAHPGGLHGGCCLHGVTCFNLLRLCVLVLYYRGGPKSFRRFGLTGAQVDYGIGVDVVF